MKHLKKVTVLFSLISSLSVVSASEKPLHCEVENNNVQKKTALERVLASEKLKSVYYYMDMPCKQLMESKTNDEFIKFARNEIKSNINKNFCDLVKQGEESFEQVDYEAQRDYVSMAEYSKLIDSLYSTYHFGKK